MDDWMEVIVPVVILILILACLFGGNIALDSYACHQKGAQMNYPAHYSVITGCMIQVENGRWIPVESYYFKEE